MLIRLTGKDGTSLLVNPAMVAMVTPKDLADAKGVIDTSEGKTHVHLHAGPILIVRERFEDVEDLLNGITITSIREN